MFDSDVVADHRAAAGHAASVVSRNAHQVHGAPHRTHRPVAVADEMRGVDLAQQRCGQGLDLVQQGVLRGEWWQALFPGLAIMITVLCLNILSEGITDAMVARLSAGSRVTSWRTWWDLRDRWGMGSSSR